MGRCCVLIQARCFTGRDAVSIDACDALKERDILYQMAIGTPQVVLAPPDVATGQL